MKVLTALIFVVSFSLPNLSLGSDIKVQMFFNSKCPCSHRLMGQIVSGLSKMEKAPEVEFYNISSLPPKMKELVEKDWKLPQALREDTEKKLALSLGVVATPEMVVFHKGKRIYKGAIIREDEKDEAKSAFVLSEIAQALEKNPDGAIENERAVGCAIDENHLILPDDI